MPIQSQTFSKKGTQVSSYTFKLTVQEDSYDIATNSSKITCFASISSSNGYYFELHGIALTLKIDGVTKYSVAAKNNTVSIPVNASNYIIMSNQSYTIPHNNDGSKTINVSLLWDDTSNKGYTYMPGDTTISGDFKLTTIPRASSITCSSFNIASNPNIVISPQITGATHTLTYSFGSGTGESGTIVTKSSDLTIPWDTTNLRSKMYQKIPNSNTLPVTFSCTTYNGNTQIGDVKSITVNAVVTNSNPIINNLALKDNVTTLTGSSDILVNNVAKPTVTGTVAAQNYATITSVEIVASDGQTASLGAITSIAHQFGIIKQSTAATEFSATVKATDSRGNSSTTRIAKLGDSYKNYSLPTITSFVADRNNATSTTIEYTATMSYWNKNFGSVSNIPYITIQYSGDGGASWSNAKVKQNVATLTGSVTGLSEDKDYLFRMIAFDKTTEIISTNTITKTVTVGKTFPYIDMTETSFTFNVPVTVTDQLKSVSGLIEGVDANNYTYSGMYALGANCTNVPASYIKLYVNGAGSGDVTQIAVTLNATSPQTFSRQRVNNSWTAWLYMTSYPVGTVITTSTNTNPSIYYGGEWTLIDKMFKSFNGTVSWTSTKGSAVVTTSRQGHSNGIRINLTCNEPVTDSEITWGQYNVGTLGVKELSYAKQTVAFADGAQGNALFAIDIDGTVRSTDFNHKTGNSSLATGAYFSIWIVDVAIPGNMLDEHCDRFFWKRTA